MNEGALDIAELANAMDEHKRRWAHDPEDGGTCGPWCADDIAAAYALPFGLDVERLARALHDQGFGCNRFRCSIGRGSSADAHVEDALFLAAAYREAEPDVSPITASRTTEK